MRFHYREFAPKDSIRERAGRETARRGSLALRFRTICHADPDQRQRKRGLFSRCSVRASSTGTLGRREQSQCESTAVPNITCSMTSNGGGVILSTTSGAGSGAVNGLAVYGAAKAGVNSLMRSIAVEYGQRGIRANAIAPSAASPGMVDWVKSRPGGLEGYLSKQPMGRLGTPEDVASVAGSGCLEGVDRPLVALTIGEEPSFGRVGQMDRRPRLDRLGTQGPTFWHRKSRRTRHR